RCGIVFEPHRGWLGKNMYCPACGARMTARPLEVEHALGRRPATTGHGTGAAPRRLLPLVVVVADVRSLWNVGSIFRTADACGVERLFLTGITGHPPRSEITKTALGAEQVVDWEYRPDAAGVLDELARRGYVPVALESGAAAVPLQTVDWPDRVCLVVGNEVAGIAAQCLDACRMQVAIPMLGVKRSFNVAVAFGIAAHRVATVMSERGSLAVGRR
ncbi:MAG TPA: TrmH family RNA methyltransferase, partial [Candidatus Polarisedimenticolaceae bacterium]|nr:TrmH family RNA methyltransferase [Candidatus Polarisedimenticolaceae bacterium]